MSQIRYSVHGFRRLALGSSLLIAATGTSGCIGSVVESTLDGSSPSLTHPTSDGGAEAARVDGGGFLTQDGALATQVDGAIVPGQGNDGSHPGNADGSASDAAVTGMPTDTGSSDPCANEDLRFATGVTLTDVALYQVTKIPLYEAGNLVTARDVPIVQSKRALVRVHVAPSSGFKARTLRAVLTLENGGTPLRLTRDLNVTAASNDSSLASTFNFDVDSANIGADTTFHAAIVETRCDVPFGTADAVRAPHAGSADLAAEVIRKLRVRVVPTTINGNTATPTQTQLDAMRSAMLAYYPVPDVELSLRDPYDLSSAWACTSGDGWSCALDAIVALRARDSQPSDIYYYAMLTPEASFRQYCGSGCTLGVAYATANPSTRYQVGIGVGYDNDLAYDTMVHELGHAHGRQHAPCAPGNSLDPSSVDQSFPNTTANTDTWGWDSRSGTLMEPTRKDVMSYCDPHWIGAYNYSAIAARSVVVNKELLSTGQASLASQVEYRNLIVSTRGANYGELVEVGVPPGEPLWADIRDAAGTLLDSVRVFRAPLSNETSAFLFVPTLPAAARTLTVDGREITLPQ